MVTGTDANLQAAQMAHNLLDRAIAAPPVAYDTRTLDAVEAVMRERIAKSSWRETARTLNLALAEIRKLREP